jgi:lipoate-protein ligase B
MKKQINIIDIKTKDYRQAYDFQRKVYEHCYKNQMMDALLFQENNPTITIGRSGTKENLLIDEKQLKNMGIEIVELDRGGDVTFHIPGQWVVSFVAHIREYTQFIHSFLRKLEDVIILVLAEYGLEANKNERHSGVWVFDKKIASVGLSIEHGITRHGFALNVNPDLRYFDYIVACGLENVKMTSMKECLNQDISMDQVRQKIIEGFESVFDLEVHNYYDEKGALIDGN